MDDFQILPPQNRKSFQLFEVMLNNTQPGLIKALNLFRDTFFNEKTVLAEMRIINIILPLEVKKLKSGTINYWEFRNRNSIYAFENLIEKEKLIVKKAFLAQGFSTVMNPDLEKDRILLNIGDTDIQEILESD